MTHSPDAAKITLGRDETLEYLDRLRKLALRRQIYDGDRAILDLIRIVEPTIRFLYAPGRPESEVKAEALEALADSTPTWWRGMYGSPDDMFAKRSILALAASLRAGESQ